MVTNLKKKFMFTWRTEDIAMVTNLKYFMFTWRTGDIAMFTNLKKYNRF